MLKLRIVVFYFFTLLFLSQNGFCKINTPLAGTFYVNDFGAVGDGKTINTIPIQKTIDACAEAGGGKVIFTTGNYLSGTIVMKSNVNRHLEQNAVLLASTNHKDFPLQPLPKYRSHKDQLGGFYAFIYAEGAANISITGSGIIDGQGKQQKPRYENPIAGDIDGRPRNILFISCKNIRVEGIHLRSSGIWNQHYLDCEDVIIDKISVYNHSNRNNDGIDIDGCRRVVLSNSIFDSDDDCITLKSTGAAACEDVVISNCVVKGIPEPEVGKVQNISISNVVAYNAGSWGSSITGIPGHPIKNISLNNTQLFTEGGIKEDEYNKEVIEDEKGYPQPTIWENLPAYGLFVRHAEGVSINNLMLGTKKEDSRVPVMAEDVNNLSIVNSLLSVKNLPKYFMIGKSVKNYKIEKPVGWNDNDKNILLIK